MSERRAVEMLFEAHNEISKFYRNPKKTKDDVEELEKWVETFYQTNLLMFPVDSAFTPYKAKLFIFPKLLRAGKIHSLFEHLTEATENSNHGVNHLYHNHSMRDGGMIWNVTSEFEDLFHSFAKAIKLSSVRRFKSGVSTEDEFLKEPPPQGMATKLYLSICSQTVPTPQLNVGKETTIFKGMKFYLISSTKCHQFEKVPPFSFNNITTKKTTKKLLEKVVTQLDGAVLGDTQFETLAEKYSELQHCYVVMEDDTLFTDYANRKRTNAKIAPKFLKSTHGDFIYVKAQYIVDCYMENKLLDVQPYCFEVNRSHFVKSGAAKMTSHMQRQRIPVDRLVLAKAALKRSRAAANLSDVPTCAPADRKSMNNDELRTLRATIKRQQKQRRRHLKRLAYNNVSISRQAYHFFQSDYAEKQKWAYMGDNGKVDVGTLSTRASDYWMRASREDRQFFFKKAQIYLGFPVTSPQPHVQTIIRK